jgi:hypothetical protein
LPRATPCRVLAAIAAGVALLPGASDAAPDGALPAAGSPRLIGILERGPLALVGRIRAPESLDAHGFAAELEVERALVGEAAPGARVALVWEEPARARPPRFADGDRVLVGLEALPQQSIWAERIAEPGRRARTLAVAERGDAFLREPSPGGLLVLEHYLALLPDERAAAPGVGRLAQLAEGAELPLARAAVLRLDALRDLDAALEAASAGRLVAALLREDADAALQRDLLDLFGRHRPRAVRAELERRASGDVPDARVIAALGRIEGELGPERTDLLLGSADAELRALGAGHAPATRSRQLAALAAADPDAAVRAAAVERLVAVRGDAAIDAALVALEDPDAGVRAAAARSIGGLGARAVPALRHVVDRGSPLAAQAAIAALRGTGSREGHRELREIAAGHPDAGVRAVARLAIGQPLDAEGH